MAYPHTKNKKRNYSGEIKNESFNYTKIEAYYNSRKGSTNEQPLNDKFCEDINLKELFKYIDRTYSRVGQQFLYNKVRTLKYNKDEIEYQEELISHLTRDKEKFNKIRIILSKLNNKDAYYIQELFTSDLMTKPKWFWAVKLLSCLSGCLIIFAFFYDFLFFILIGILIINMAIHYWNKKNIFIYVYSIPQLISLLDCSNELVLSGIPLPKWQNNIRESIKSIHKLREQMLAFRMEAILNSSELLALLQLLIEYIKILLVIEPIIVFNVLKKLGDKKSDIEEIFNFVGRIDSILSVIELRKNASYCCIPKIDEQNNEMTIKDLYHPLVKGCIANSITIRKGDSILLTGSNMSGKTTFIKSLAINILLAQNIHTCFAKECSIYPTYIYTAINIVDNLLDNKSYYLEEVETIKSMINTMNENNCNFYLIDELFKGTNTRERIAAGKAVLSYLGGGNNIVIASTHDIELAEIPPKEFKLYHFSEIIKDKDIIFDYKLKTGKLTIFNAIRILEINKYPEKIINNAQHILASLKKNNDENKYLS